MESSTSCCAQSYFWERQLSPGGGFGAERPFLSNCPWLSWSNCGQGTSCARHSTGTNGTVSIDVQLNFILFFSLLPLIPGHIVIILIRLKPMWEQNEPWHLCNSNSWAHPAAAREGNPQQLAPELNQAPCNAKKYCATPRNAVPRRAVPCYITKCAMPCHPTPRCAMLQALLQQRTGEHNPLHCSLQKLSSSCPSAAAL